VNKYTHIQSYYIRQKISTDYIKKSGIALQFSLCV